MPPHMLEAWLCCKPQHRPHEPLPLQPCLSSSTVEESCLRLESEKLEDMSRQKDEQEADKAFPPCVLADENQEPRNLGVQQCLVKTALQSCLGTLQAAKPLCWDSLGRSIMAEGAKTWRPGSSGFNKGHVWPIQQCLGGMLSPLSGKH